MNVGRVDVPLKSDITVEHPFEIDDAIKMHNISNGVFVGGGTLLQIQWESGAIPPNTLINLSLIELLKGIVLNESSNGLELAIRPLTTISECLHHPLIMEFSPLLAEACKHIAAPAVRNRATIGGNVASGIGDTIPALLTLDAKVKIACNNTIQLMKLSDWLKCEKTSFLLLEIIIPQMEKGTHQFFHKIGRREAFTASLVTVCGQWRKDEEGNFEFIRLSVGGGSHFPTRLEKLEKLLVKKKGNIDKEFFYSKILEEFHSYSDPFITETYRKKVVANILIGELASS